MNKEKKKYLKNIGKKIIDDRSEELKKILHESNPVSTSDPVWIKNYKETSIREKHYRNNRSKIYPKDMIGVSFLLLQVPVDMTIEYLPIQGYYFYCLICGDLVPMNPEIDLKCQCGLISLESTNKNVSFTPEKVKVVKLIAKASSKSTNLNSVLGKLKSFLRFR